MSLSSGSSQGFSLTEVLVALVIMAMTVAVVTQTSFQKSDALALKAYEADLRVLASEARAQAILEDTNVILTLPPNSCRAREMTLTFFADGTALQALVCVGLDRNEVPQFLVLDTLTASFMAERTE